MVPPEVLIDALIFSNLLSLLSIGLTLTYLTLKVPNFAHGDFATVGIYLAYTALRLLSLHPLFMLPPAFVFSGLVALFFYYVVFKPLSDRGANIVSLMVASFTVTTGLGFTVTFVVSSPQQPLLSVTLKRAI